jgi:hypothetical protein
MHPTHIIDECIPQSRMKKQKISLLFNLFFVWENDYHILWSSAAVVVVFYWYTGNCHVDYNFLHESTLISTKYLQGMKKFVRMRCKNWRRIATNFPFLVTSPSWSLSYVFYSLKKFLLSYCHFISHAWFNFLYEENFLFEENSNHIKFSLMLLLLECYVVCIVNT